MVGLLSLDEKPDNCKQAPIIRMGNRMGKNVLRKPWRGIAGLRTLLESWVWSVRVPYKVGSQGHHTLCAFKGVVRH